MSMRGIDTQVRKKRRRVFKEVANLALFLVSDMGNMITGQMIYMSGGRGVYDIR